MLGSLMGTCFDLVSTGKAQVRLPNWQFLLQPCFLKQQWTLLLLRLLGEWGEQSSLELWGQ